MTILTIFLSELVKVRALEVLLAQRYSDLLFNVLPVAVGNDIVISPFVTEMPEEPVSVPAFNVTTPAKAVVLRLIPITNRNVRMYVYKFFIIVSFSNFSIINYQL